MMDRVPGIVFGFGTSTQPVPPQLTPYWDKGQVWKQVHGTKAVAITEPKQKVGEADAFYTEIPGLPVAVRTADCVPILLARRDGKKIAAIHAGWRGTLARILRVAFTTMDEDPRQWVASIGPCISWKNYQVSDEMVADFLRQFEELDSRKIFPKPRMLDLVYVNQSELMTLGVSEIEVTDICTFDSDDHHSYRQNKQQLDRQLSGLVIRP